MHNNVVQAARQTFVGLGWRTLRFNFRGAGSSGGQAGKGQKDAGDLIAVSKFIRAVSPGRIDFASYSYGAWVTMEAIRMGLSADSLILISPPLDFTSFEGLDLPDVPTLIVIGNKDGFCQVSSLTNWLSGQVCARSPALEILSGVDHFYRGAERLLSAKIADFLKVRNIAPRTAE